MFSPEDQAAINHHKSRLRVTRDPCRNTLLVTRLPHHTWMLFSYDKDDCRIDKKVQIIVLAVSSNITYNDCITGAPGPPWTAINAAWEVAEEALQNIARVPAVYKLPFKKGDSNYGVPKQRMTSGVALVLAAQDRIDRFGGLTDDRERIQGEGRLTSEERKVIERRKRGLIVL